VLVRAKSKHEAKSLNAARLHVFGGSLMPAHRHGRKQRRRLLRSIRKTEELVGIFRVSSVHHRGDNVLLCRWRTQFTNIYNLMPCNGPVLDRKTAWTDAYFPLLKRSLNPLFLVLSSLPFCVSPSSLSGV